MNHRIAGILLDLNAVALRTDPPFTWASGRFSPIYCDNRLIMSSPADRKEVARAFVELIRASNWQPDVIAGTATAGIPHAAWVADLMELPMVYVRAQAKGHGKGNQIEGRLDAGRKVVLIEDLISTGGSSLQAADGVVEAGGKLLGVAAVFTYGLPVAVEKFRSAGVPAVTLTDFGSLMNVALSRGTLTAKQKELIASWQADPSAWSLARGGAA